MPCGIVALSGGGPVSWFAWAFAVVFLGEVAQSAVEQVVDGDQTDESVRVCAGDHRCGGERVPREV